MRRRAAAIVLSNHIGLVGPVLCSEPRGLLGFRFDREWLIVIRCQTYGLSLLSSGFVEADHLEDLFDQDAEFLAGDAVVSVLVDFV